MQLTEQWIREGFSSYYVVKKEQELTYEKNILRYHTLPCLLPCEFRIQDGEEYYYYETGIYSPLKDRINRFDPKLFFTSLLEAFEEIESYLLSLDHLKLEPELLFVDKEEKPVICYLPEYEKNIFDQLRELLEGCIDMISGDHKKKVRFYYEFHSFLVKEKPNMEQMKEYLEISSKDKDISRIRQAEEIDYVPEMLYNEIKEKENEETLKTANNVIQKIIYGILFAASMSGNIYFMICIFQYGFYYLFLAGFLITLAGIGFGVYGFYKLWRKQKNKNKNVDEHSEKMQATVLLNENTTFLEEDDKTVLLMEEPIGKLISVKDKTEEISLNESGFIIGSSLEGTDHQLEGMGISRRHIRFYQEGRDVFCEDLESTNGVKVNGRRVKTTIVKDGDIIKIGLKEFIFKDVSSV